MSTDPIWPTSPWFMVYGSSADTALFWGVINLQHLRADQLTLQSWQPPFAQSHPPAAAELSTQSRNHPSHKRRQLITVSRQWHEIEPSRPGMAIHRYRWSTQTGQPRFTCLVTFCSEKRERFSKKKKKSEMKFSQKEISQQACEEKGGLSCRMITWHSFVFMPPVVFKGLNAGLIIWPIN